VKRVVIVGPGASGKSTLAVDLGKITRLPVVELDKLFWQPGLVETPPDRWIDIQRGITEQDEWILDGDLGPYDVIEVRLRAADTVIFLDFSFLRCAWRAVRRSPERLDFWLWLLRYRRRSRPLLMKEIRDHAPQAAVYRLRNPKEVRRFVSGVSHGHFTESV
jgi:adenylate kinase family enzyme